MVERGDATCPDVDTAMKLGAGYIIGPFELMDHIGLDLVKMIMERPNNSHAEHTRLIDNLVKEGKFGRKTGEGFYKY